MLTARTHEKPVFQKIKAVIKNRKENHSKMKEVKFFLNTSQLAFMEVIVLEVGKMEMEAK